MKPFRVLVVDASRATRAILAAVLFAEGDMEVVGSAGTGTAALSALSTCDPTVVMLDLDRIKQVNDKPVLIEVNDTYKPACIYITENGAGFPSEDVLREDKLSDPLRADYIVRHVEAMQAAIDRSQEHVTGTVRLKLYKGLAGVVGRKSPYSLYSEAHVTFEDDAGAYDQKDAAGFIRLNALRLRTLAMRGKLS